MRCELCGEFKRDILLRPIECKCYERFQPLHTQNDYVIEFGETEKPIPIREGKGA